MEALCRLSYSGDGAMITMGPWTLIRRGTMDRMRLLVLLTTCCVLATGCDRQDEAPLPGVPDHAVTFERSSGGETQLDVWVADTDAERARGLMKVDGLGADQGMAFVFEEPTDATFWMRDTLLPLSIAFVDAAGEIVTVREMTPCEADPCPTYAADGPFVLAVEANAGYFAREHVGVGDRAHLTDVTSG